MANRRKSVTFSELDNYQQPKGKGAILRTAEEVAAEQEQLQVEELVISEPQEPGKQETLQTRKQESKETSSSGKKRSSKSTVSPTPASTEYKKATYKMSEEALDALDDSKRLLRREFGFKASLESIVEAAILDAYHDLQENNKTSFLVNWFAGKQENK